MGNAGTFTVGSNNSESIQAAAAERVRRDDAADKVVFDRLTQLVSALLDVPVSLLTIADAGQLLFASYAGPAEPWAMETFPVSEAHCQFALGSRAAFAVEDARTNPHVCELAATTELGVVAYLGVPLLTSSGEPIGVLCAIDVEPRVWSEMDIHVIEDLAATVMAYIEARPRPFTSNGSGVGLNIAAVARRTGIASDTLRKWERRYGVLRPQRTPGGQRRYDDRDIARVEWLRDRLAEGFRIGAAAALLAPTNGGSANTPDDLRGALVAAAAAGDPARLTGLVEQTFTLHSVAVAIEEIIAPALRSVGDAWKDGADAIGREHLLTETVRARLEQMLSDRRAGVRGKVVLACAPGERHELGLLGLAVLLQADGWLVAYLGADAPLESTLALAQQVGADAICISVTMPESLERLAAALETLPGKRPLVMAGGPAVAGAKRLPEAIVTGSLTEVVAKLHAA